MISRSFGEIQCLLHFHNLFALWFFHNNSIPSPWFPFFPYRLRLSRDSRLLLTCANSWCLYFLSFYVSWSLIMCPWEVTKLTRQTIIHSTRTILFFAILVSDLVVELFYYPGLSRGSRVLSTCANSWCFSLSSLLTSRNRLVSHAFWRLRYDLDSRDSLHLLRKPRKIRRFETFLPHWSIFLIALIW